MIEVIEVAPRLIDLPTTVDERRGAR